MLTIRAMKRLFLLVLMAPLSGTALLAAPGGSMNTLSTGRWTCELPGDAVTPPVRQPAEDFEIVPDSSYRTPDAGQGTYLRLGSSFTMTSGPFSGRRYHLSSETESQRLDGNDKPIALRCVRTGAPRGGPANAQQ
jgi:hypothetical protein